MATTISSGTNPYKLGSPPDFGTLYSGRALEFDGVTDSVNCGTTPFQSLTDVTVSLWLNTDDVTTWVKPFQYYVSSTNAWGLRIYNGNLEIYNDIDNASAAIYPVAISVSTWYHVVAVLDSLENKLYVNGVLEGSGTSSGGDWSSFAGTLYLGQRGNSTEYYNGKFSNVQVWDKVWSLSDVQYAYTHPEKLITDNSAVTSGTTISNLKAWYPCTEGNPRSPQTTVYDGSPKELGSELLTNGNFETDAVGITTNGGNLTGWTKGGTNDADNNWSIVSGKSCKIITDSSGTATHIKQSILTAGKYYKVTLNISDVTDGGIKLYVGTSGATVNYTTTGIKTIYETADDADFEIWRNDTSGTNNVTFDDVSVKEVQMGNHGTTTFIGDELLGDPTLDNASYFTFSGVGAGETFNVQTTNAGKLTAIAAQDTTLVKNSLMTTGRTYRFSLVIDAYTDGRIRGNNHTGSWSVTPSGTGTITQDFVATGANFEILVDVNADFTATDMSLKEVGVASGWTTADAEPLIPQTALMGMSKPMLFSQTNDVYLTNTSLNLSHAQLSWSMWLFGSEAGGAEHLFATSTGGGGDLTNVFMNFSSDYVFRYGSASLSVTSGDAGTHQFTAGKWIHAVFIADSTNNLVQVYQNGALTLSSSQTFDTPVYGNGISVGARGGSGSPVNAYEDQMNEFSVWNTALTLAEVQELFNDGVALDATTHSKVANLKGYWRNDGATSWEDRSATSNTLTLTGSPDTILLPEGTTSGKDILGFPLTHTNNGWLNLDGNEYVDAGDNSVFAIVHDLSIECWFKTAVTGLSYGLVGKGGAAGNTGYFLFKLSNEKVRFVVDQSDGTATTADSGSTLSDGDWHHVVGVYNSGTNIQLYIDNGSPVTVTTDIESKALDDAGSFIIGDTQDGIYQFDGSIDEARLYNRALSAAEVTKNYKHGKAKHS